MFLNNLFFYNRIVLVYVGREPQKECTRGKGRSWRKWTVGWWGGWAAGICEKGRKEISIMNPDTKQWVINVEMQFWACKVPWELSNLFSCYPSRNTSPHYHHWWTNSWRLCKSFRNLLRYNMYEYILVG